MLKMILTALRSEICDFKAAFAMLAEQGRVSAQATEKLPEKVAPDFGGLKGGGKPEANILMRKGAVWLVAPGAGHY